MRDLFIAPSKMPCLLHFCIKNLKAEIVVNTLSGVITYLVFEQSCL